MGLPKSTLPTPAAASIVAAAAIAAAVGGCSGPSSATGTPTSALIAAPPPPPITTTEAAGTAGPPSPDQTAPGAPGTSPDGTCASVRTENGLNLQVVDVSASGAGCAEAVQLVRDLVARIRDWHPPGSGDAVSVSSVQGWVCVSGPQTGGATTCSNQARRIDARVVP